MLVQSVRLPPMRKNLTSNLLTQTRMAPNIQPMAELKKVMSAITALYQLVGFTSL